jgi:hypothetical protein
MIGKDAMWHRQQLKYQVASGDHFKPAAMRRVRRSREDFITNGTPEDQSRIQTQSADRSGGAAPRALNLRRRNFRNEDFLQQTCRSIAVQDKVRVSLCHGAFPPEGPKRSILIVRGHVQVPPGRLAHPPEHRRQRVTSRITAVTHLSICTISR